jgi:predicted nucleic acid-binding protein
MVFAAVIDANALYPFSLRDTLLRLAQVDLYAPLWSARILEEMRRNLVVDQRMSERKAHELVDAMRRIFEEAEVDAARIAQLEVAMTNHPDDRHVLAAAVAGGAEVIVTFNIRDFPPAACEPLGVEVVHPDDFLVDLFDLDPGATYDSVVRHAAALRRPPLEVDELLERLETAGVPRFVGAVRQQARRQR